MGYGGSEDLAFCVFIRLGGAQAHEWLPRRNTGWREVAETAVAFIRRFVQLA
jgi:hypothetical protein